MTIKWIRKKNFISHNKKFNILIPQSGSSLIFHSPKSYTLHEPNQIGLLLQQIHKIGTNPNP